MLAGQFDQSGPPTEYDREVEKQAKEVLDARRMALKKAGYVIRVAEAKKPRPAWRGRTKRTK